jgi:helicase
MDTSEIVTFSDATTNVKSSEFPYAKFSFDEFNPVQSALLPWCDKDCNGLIAAATSCGKTVMSEMFASYTIRSLKKKFIFLCPLRALAYEKYSDWTSPTHHFSDLNIGIYTGDYREKDGFESNDIIIMTSEMLNHKVRTGKNKWIEDVGLCTVDESHTLAMDGRGPHLEAAMLGFTRINKTSRIILLSGTLPNVDEVASWVKSLNGKETFCIKSTFRPCELKIHTMTYDEDMNVRDAIAEECCSLVSKFSNDKFIVFVHVKSIGNYIVDKLANRGVEALFHNANLDSKERIKIERRFKEDKHLRVIVATSTLAQGLNLPARRVIIAGVHRGTKLVPSYDILQMSGRAGRPAFDKQGDAYILLPAQDSNNLAKICTTAWPVMSKMLETSDVTGEYNTLIFHLLAEIHEERVKCISDIEKWYERTLSNFQKLKLRMGHLLDSLEKLSRMGIVKIDNSTKEISLGVLGKISVLFYVNPHTVFSYSKNFGELFNKREFSDVDICVALSNQQDNLIGSLSKEDRFNMRNFLERIEQTHRNLPDGVAKMAYIHYRALHGNFDSKYASIAKTIQQDFPRTVAVLQAIDSWSKKWDRKDFFTILEKRMKHGVPARLVNLVEIKNIGKIRAEKLYTAGFKSRSDIVKNLSEAAKIAGVNQESLKSNIEYN